MNKTKRSSPRASTSQKTQASRLSSLAIPIVVGLMVVAVIVGAILSLENRQPASAAVLGTLSVPVVTAQPRATTSIPFPNVPRISVQDTIKKLDKGQAILIDVRSKSSYDQSHAAGALSLPEEEVDARLNELPQDKEWILYCT